MPTLPVPRRTGFEAPVSGGRRASVEDFDGIGLGAASGKVRQAALSFLGETEESEARKALVASSEIRAEYARKLDEAALTGADLGKLKEEMRNKLSAVGENFQTRRGQDSLDLYVSNTELMFDEQANKIAVQRAYSTARLEGQKFLTSAGTVLQSNPAYLGVAEKDAEEFGNTLVGVRPEQRAEIVAGLKSELNMSAAVAVARIDPEGAKKRLEAGEWTLTPDQRNIALNKADTEIRAKRAEEAYVRAEEERQRREANDKARDKHFKLIIDGGATRRGIMDDADLSPATREHLIDYMEARSKARAGQERQSDPTVKRDLWLAIHAPDGDPKKIYNADPIFAAVKAGKLNTSDANQLNSLVAGQKDEQGRAFGQRLQARVSTIAAAMRSSPEYQAQPELAAAIQLELIGRVEQAASALRRENKNPAVLIDDPNDKDYFFKPGIVKTIADDIRRQKNEQRLDAARVSSPADLLALGLKEGDAFIAPDGQVAKVTAGMLAKAKEQQQKTFVPSGERVPRDEPMPLATWKYRRSVLGIPATEDAGVTVVDDNGRPVNTEELR